MQTEVTGPVIENAGEKYRNKAVKSVFTLKLWPDGVDIKTAEPMATKEFSYLQKTVVDGKTVDELAERVEVEAVKDMKKVIAEYDYAESFSKVARVTQMASNITEAING